MRVLALAAVLFLLAVTAGWGGSVGKARSVTVSYVPAGLWAISCTAPGECAAGGAYGQGWYSEAFVVTETGGTWGNPIKVPGMATLDRSGEADVHSISCAALGECAAGGYYTDRRGDTQAFVVSETNGSWGKAIEVPGTAALNTRGWAGVVSISCHAAGECVAGGEYTGRHERAFVVSETNGTWGDAISVPGMATLNPGGRSAGVESISCAAAGECAAGGSYRDSASQWHAFLVSETSGSWGEAIEVPGTTSAAHSADGAGVISLACAAVGECVAGGYDTDSGGTAFVDTETSGIWGDAVDVPGMATLNTGGFAHVDSLSCAAAGECAAGGAYYDSHGTEHAFVVSETNGIWSTAIEVPGTRVNTYGDAEVRSVSCGAVGECVAGGFYSDGSGAAHAFVVNETSGGWGTAIEVPGTATGKRYAGARVDAVSCGAVGACVAVGSRDTDSGGEDAFVAGETSGTWGDAHLLRNFPAACPVPSVTGTTIRAAKRRLEQADCGVGEITYVHSIVTKGRVVAQRPKAYTVRRAGTKIALAVSKG